jgi:hypothetical protein
MLNLHAAVRPAINAVNPDQTIQWRRSTGYTIGAGLKQEPTYAADEPVQGNVQSLTWTDLQHRDMQNIQGVARAVYLFGNVQGVVRPDSKGADLLVFPQNRGGTPQLWLVAAVLETATPDAMGWCKVGVVLQDGVP